MEELFRLIEKKGEATDSEIFNGIYKEHLRLGLMPLNEVSIHLKKIILDLTRIKPGAIHDRLQFYILILIVILFPSGGNFLSFPFNLRNDQILFIYVTYSLRKEIKLPLEMISQIFYESVKKFSLQKPFYELKSIYFYQRVPELLKNIDYRDSREFIRVFLDFFESCQDLSNIDHSTIIFFNSMVQQCISYLIHDRNDIIVNQCNTLFTRIFSLHTVCPSVILLHFLHLWYIFFRFCTEKEIKISYEPQIHLISQLFKSISISQKHELYRFFHWNLVLTIRSKFPDAICEFNSLCLTLTFYKTIYHIESMRDMVIPSTEFLKEVLEQSKNKKRFSYCTILSFFNSCLKEFINSFSEFYLLVINPNSEETQQNKIKPIKISFSDQQKCSRNSDHSEFHFLDDHLYTIMNEKIIELSEFSLQFESLITRCELTKARIVTAGYFLFPCYKRALSNFEYLPYVIQITKTFLNVVIYINHAIFSIQYINVIPNKNLDLPLIINKIKDSFTEMPLRMAPYISITIAKLLFKKCKIFKITRLTVEFLCSLNDDILNLLMKDMIQIILTNKSMFFSKDFETTYWICRFTILTIRILSDRKHEELEKELIPVFQKSILRSILTNIKKISNQNIVFKTLNIFVKHFKLNYTCYPAKPTYLDEVMVYAKKDFLYSFLSLLPYNTDMQKAQFFNPVYEYALKYGDQESINIASQYCLKIFTINEKPKITNDLHYANLYQAWKNANLTKEDREKMITTIPYYSDYFISNRTHEIHDKLSYNEIYNCIFNSINSDPDSVILAFSVFQNAILNPELTLDEGKSLLNIFMRCLVYSFMRERIDKFIPIMLKYHIDLFLKEISNVFLLSLIEAPSVSVSYVASEMHDLAIKFVEIVTKENPDCPLILQTIDQVLLIIPKKERAYSILSLICILLRCCPKFVTVELIRSFIIASNDIFAFDVFFNRSISQLFEKYISVIDKETAQIFGESLFYLFSTTIINFRIPILQTLFKLNLNPPKLEFFKKSNFKCFELQKIMVSLLYESQINPFIIEQTKKCILEKNELVAAPERFSRRFSLIYSLVSNDHNFSYFADDQSFSNKLMTLLNNSMVSSYRELRKEAKTFFLTLLRLIEKETKETKFENPVELKLFEFFDNRLEKIIYVKRLLKIKPELFQPKLFLDFIASIGSYLTKSEEEQSNYLANLKIFFSFIGSKEINKYQGLGEFLSKNVNSYLTYFTHFIESYHKLLISNQFPYHTIIIKHTFNFLINFPEKTLKCMIDSAQSSQLYPSYLALIDFDDSTPFHNQFINLCKNKYDPFLYPLHYFEVIVKMTKIKSCVENYEFLDLIDFIFNQIVTRYDNITNNLYFMLFRMITALTNTFKFNEDINRFMLLLQSFDVPLTFNSISYRKIIKKCVKQTSQQFKLDLIKYFIRNPGIIRRAIFDKALQHLIKQTKLIPDELIDETWNFLIETKYISSMLRLLQHSVPSDEIISKICNIMRNTMMESDTELIIQTIKLMIQLGKLDKLPADIYWAYIKQSLYLFKFIDIPFSKYTLQMLKLMKDHFPNVPTDIGDGFSLFIHNKCNSIRETQRIIEILLCAPPLTQVNCFSPIIILSSFLNDRLQMINDLPQKASFDCILNIGIKYIALNEVPQNELEKYFDVTYRFLELMVIGMPYLTFLDKISSYLNDHDLPTPPESLFNAISNENNKFLLPSFVSLCIFMKKDPIKCLKCSSLIERALEFIEKSDNFINAITLQCFTELVCQDERYVELIYSIYKSLMEDISQKKEQKAFQIIFSMMKANVLNEHYEQMWDLLIEKEKKEAYTYLNAKEQVRYTKYMLSKSANHELFVIQSANVFLDSNLVSIEAKILLISNLANFVNYSNADLIFNCVEKIERLGISIKRNFTAEIADILIEAARCSTYLNKIKYIRKLGLLISEKITDKLDFVFNCLPVFLWRNETVIFVLSVFATDLKKWLSIFAFGNSFQHIISEFVVHFLRDHLKEETIKLFSDFFSKVLSTNDKTQFDGIINGLSYIFFSTDFPIHSKIFAKAEKVINHPEYLIDFMDNLSTFSDSEEYFLPHYMNDFIFGKFGYHLSVAERAVISLNLLSKFNTSDELYYQIRPDSNDSKKLYFLFHQINEDEKCFWSFISKKNFYFEIPVDEINKTSYNLELDHQVIESLLNQAHEKLAIEFQENMSFFKDELFASIETAIQIEKYLIQQKMQKKRPTDIPKVSMDLLLFKQSINPFLLSMLSNFKDELKSLLKIPLTHHPEIENSSESPPILSVPSFYVKNFKKISGITAHGLFAVSVEQIQNFLDTLRMSCPPNNKDLIKLSPILFEIYRISPCDDLFKAVYCSYSLLVHTNVNVPLYIRHQAGARILLLLQFACNKAHFDVIHYNSAVFERKNLDIWRHWLNQLVILSTKKEMENILLPLYIDMGYRALLYAKQMHLKDIEDYLTNLIPPSLIPLEKLGIALDIIFENKGLGDDYDHIISLINQSFPFSFPLYKKQITIYHLSGPIKYLSDQLVLLTLSTTINSYTPILIQRCAHPNSDKSSCITKTFLNSLYLMNLITYSSYTTRTKSISISSPFAYEIGNYYLLAIVNGESLYLKEIFDQITQKEKSTEATSIEEDGEDDASTSLLKLLNKKCTKYEFILNRNSLLRSLSAHSFIRHIFSIGYPHLEKMVLFINPGSWPLLTIDYERNILLDDLRESSIRYSPIFYRLFGCQTGIPVFQIGIAAVACAFVDNLESIRSYLEVLFYDKLLNINDEKNEIDDDKIFDYLITKRTEIEEKILNLTPPSGMAASVDDLVEWMSGMDSLIQKAMNESIQPASAFPWF